MFDPTKPIEVLDCNVWCKGKYIAPRTEPAVNHGHIVEYLDYDRWRCITAPESDIRNTPEPQYRPFTAETFPALATVEIRKKGHNGNRHAIGSLNESCVFPIGTGNVSMMTQMGQVYYSELLKDYEITTDGGKTWQPCGELVK